MRAPITTLLPVLALTLLWPVGDAWAQLAGPNEAGVAMGHLHYHVRDVAANTKFWIAVGGTPAAKLGGAEVVRFPEVLVLISQGEPSGGNAGAVVSHVAFKVPNLAQALARWEASGITVIRSSNPAVLLANLVMPDGDKVEIFEELTENARFTLSAGDDPVADRHNRKMAGPIVTHHIHLDLPKGADADGQAWYVRMFGAKAGTRYRYKAADLPGINMNFSGEAATANAPTKGRLLDHIGFEVKNLEAFTKKLEANGVKFDIPYARTPSGIGRAFLTDPWGTSIELTEGLNGL